IMRCSDDGEPAQTAGRPMLDVLINKGVYNVVVVVTRYFGGVLLGTGGLVRAYQGATIAGLDNCILMKECQGYQVQITTDYNGYGKIEYILRERNIPMGQVEYLDNVKINLVIPEDQIGFVEAEVADKTSGSATFEKGNLVEYGLDGDTVILL
ncbi:MAG: YigZ family protein, partial [Lachnospiraceae bacterium]|nr:YigZ family protein [Lachnospiraceae bacterium]